jgi:DNA repair exonuclease SbcCD ATPase subunit
MGTGNIDQGYGDKLQAQMRAADARLDQLEAAARARRAQSEMDEISGLRAQRDRVQKRVAEARQQAQEDWRAVRQEVEPEVQNFRKAIADANDRYSAWDQAREKHFNARLDEADAALRRSTAQDAELAADTRDRIAEAREELKAKSDEARRNYASWRERRNDTAAVRSLNSAELELDEALDRYALAIRGVLRGG